MKGSVWFDRIFGVIGLVFGVAIFALGALMLWLNVFSGVFWWVPWVLVIVGPIQVWGAINSIRWAGWE